MNGSTGRRCDSADARVVPEKAAREPFLDEVPEGEDRWFRSVARPDHDEGDGVAGAEGDEDDGGFWGWGGDGFGDDADAGTGLDIAEDGINEAWGMADSGIETGGGGGGHDGVVGAGAFAAREDDDRFAGELVPGEGGSSGPAVVAGQGGAESFLAEDEMLEREGLVGEDRAGEADREPPVGDHFPDPLGGAFFEVNGHPRVAAAVFGEDPPEERAGGRADIAEPEFAFFAGGGAPDAAEGLFETFEKDAGFLEKHGAGGGEAGGPPVAVDEADAEVGLKLLDGAAQGGLGDAEASGGAGETEVFGDGLEIAQVAEIHGGRWVDAGMA